MDLLKIELELKKRLDFPYLWGVKQNDVYDNLTNFIYDIYNFEDLQRILREKFEKKERFLNLYNYALNRWFNFWSSYAIENIFCSFPNVKPSKNKKDRLEDFEIEGIKFDHKTTIFPKKYNKTIQEAQENPIDLIKWLYDNQSQQKRMHFKNRLFIVLYSTNNEHWKLKAEIIWLKDLINNYVTNFDPQKIFTISLDENKILQADIIWGIK